RKSRNFERVVLAYWTTTVSPPSRPPSAARSGSPSKLASQRFCFFDQVNPMVADGHRAVKDLVGLPPGGASPKRNPMSRGLAAFGARLSRSLGSAWGLYGIGLEPDRKQAPPAFSCEPPYPGAWRTCFYIWLCTPEGGKAGRPNCGRMCRSEMRAPRTGPTRLGSSDE